MSSRPSPVAPPVRRGALPNALVVGPQRTGTTWIHRYLQDRGDVGLPAAVKEPWYFDVYYDRGLEWYARLFEGAGDAASGLVVDVTPGYFQHAEAPARAARDLGRVPAVCILREPVARTFSMYLHMRRYGMTELGLRDAVEELPILLGGSLYATNLARWREALGEEQVSVLFHEALHRDPDAFARDLCERLGIGFRAVGTERRERVNEATMPRSTRLARLGWKASVALRSRGLHSVVEGAKALGLQKRFFGRPGGRPLPTLGDDDRAWLRDRLAPEVDRLEGILGVDLSGWEDGRVPASPAAS